ncbi:zinc finger protein 438 isoform X1 [Lontra canadensis]|uniref:zinc finger protein 438 isoform X1 n=2 Tax=Lontra canadensis TaxID=76717 RepID=UPI0013F3083C|nr:zinc finger protein 438 isoform X1 [Lontra canadensis]XP_032693800.1 zinc finger protein 438 isoform X1 [Lontra canadensis]XP_032693801.1 zinc finger protein 438 isoform X1 [Lontra canadensis]XP_032693802.1 zinc finger protein 438 isoform X1 [Lontra canadensis]XP_032693803.1 zinc finger protein 438 isoform X1 [Lontra canadensis]
MQNSLSVPPKDQGESHISSGQIQSGKGLQNKSQFRTIAPKIMPKVLTSRVLSCHSPSLSDQVNPGPSINAKPLGVPAQNYALMQVAGQEGTFSLVALPHVASAQSIQKPRLPLPENVKLPIPRYQPPRNNKGSRKKPIQSSSETGAGIPPAQTHASPSPLDHPEPPHKAGLLEQVPSRDQAPASISTAAPTNQGGPGDSPPLVTSDCGDTSPPATPPSSTPEELSGKQDLAKPSGKANLVTKKTCSKPSSVAGEKLKEQVHLAKAMTILSPAVFGNTVQLISPVPRGKLPILPYARMKTAEVCKGPSDINTADSSLPGLRAVCDQTASITEGFHAATETVGKAPAPQSSKQNPCESTFCPATRLDLGHKAKLNSGAAKRRVRKRKVPEEMLAFQGKRRKCIINKCKDGKERVKTDPQESRDQKPGALKKYRSIMPKPVIMVPALAPLASPAGVLQPHAPGSLGQDVLFSNPLTPKYLGWKQDGGTSPKPSSTLRNGFPSLKKPWHRCHVCDHHFQFKQHLRDHMNTHTNRRPYSCRLCRKAYVRSGSLSAHMRLQHGENRLKKLVCCEFCAKVFGHVRVYFGHLKEVHRVVISTEPSPGERQPGESPRNRGLAVRGTEGSGERENKSSLEEDLLLTQADEVKLQIKCGRCQITAQSFAEIKFHLLYVHGEEIQGRLQEEILPGSRGTQEELVKYAAPFWKQHPERRKLLHKHGPPEEEFPAFPKLKRQLCLYPQKDMEILRKAEGAQAGPSEAGAAPWAPEGPNPHVPLLRSHSGLNCILCTQTLPRKEELLLHWEQQHNCENPSKLWTILHTLCHQGVIGLSDKSEQ